MFADSDATISSMAKLGENSYDGDGDGGMEMRCEMAAARVCQCLLRV